ncbi:MAG: hypothetical protein ACKOFJ_01620 [Actinomycetota bacterium]
MFKFRTIVVFLISLGLVLSFAATGRVIAAQGSYEDQGFWISEGQDSSGAPMTNLKVLVDTNDPRKGEIVCSSTLDPKCTGKVIGNASMYLIPCSDLSTVACINEVYAIGTDGLKIKGTYVRSIAKVSNLSFEQNSAIKLAAGEGMGGLWRFPGVVHGAKSDIYSVQARITGNNSAGNSIIYYNTAQFGISAVEESTTQFQDPIVGVNNEGMYLGGYAFDQNCVMHEKGICYKRTTFPKNYRFGIEVKLPNSLLGWFHGRFAKPDFSVTSDSDNSFRYRVEASPVVVPEVKEKIPFSSWTSEFRDYVREQWPFSGGMGYMMPGVAGKFALEITRRFLPMVNDKATASASFWVVKTLNEWADGKITESISPRVLSCTKSAGTISGLVTTNAMVYSQGPPDFNEARQSLDYKVLSPHFDESGKENLGSYDLLIDSGVARCIYGFSRAPIKAELEIIASDGTTKIATTSLGERGNWLFLSANGFSYSDPIIRVILSQEKVTESSPTPTPIASSPMPEVITSPTPSVSVTPTPLPSAVKTIPSAQKSSAPSQKIVTITCKRGNQLKNLSGKSGAKLTCPKGWKLVLTR